MAEASAKREWLVMNRKGPWEGYRRQTLSPSRLPLRAHRRETSGYEAAFGQKISRPPRGTPHMSDVTCAFTWVSCVTNVACVTQFVTCERFNTIGAGKYQVAMAIGSVRHSYSLCKQNRKKGVFRMKIAILYSHRLLGQPKDIFTIEIMNATFCFYEQ